MLLSLAASLLIAHHQQGVPVGAPASATTDRNATLVELRGGFRVLCGEAQESPKVSFPLPRRYRSQIPLSFALQVKPESARVAVRTLPGATDDGVLELTLAPMKRGQKVEVAWRSVVAADLGEGFSDLPAKAPFPVKFPEEALPWLASSRYVQSDEGAIKREAREMKGKDVVSTIVKTLAGQQQIILGQRGMATDCSSVQALTLSGSCTCNANLLAALLRANGVPARILAGYPTWANRPIQTHYIVEAYVPEYGWYPIEPTMGVAGWPCSSMPIVSIVPVRHEEWGTQRANIAPGVPYLTLNETNGGIVTVGVLKKDGSDHEAKNVGNVKLSPAAWSAEGSRWDAWLKATYRVWSDHPIDLPSSSSS